MTSSINKNRKIAKKKKINRFLYRIFYEYKDKSIKKWDYIKIISKIILIESLLNVFRV